MIHFFIFIYKLLIPIEVVAWKCVESDSGAPVAFLASYLVSNGAGLAGLAPLAEKNNRFTKFRRGEGRF